MSREYTLKQLEGFLKKLPKRMRQAAEDGLQNGAVRSLPILQRSADTAPPASKNGSVGARDSGRYRGAFTYRRIPLGTMLYNLMAYADIIESGRKRGAKPPPIAVIELWLQRRAGFSPEKAKKAAIPVARAIGKRGLRGRRVFGRSRAQIQKVMREEVQKKVMTVMSIGAQ